MTEEQVMDIPPTDKEIMLDILDALQDNFETDVELAYREGPDDR